ncbi:unnamed protein product [Paramecium sonneborni]|uniref:Uncharacterized protein n=1 Tax=Paramecium sonneborni TaxID=65129 RepID=A0A8S1RPX4_9CILI|nr:unnamed protein product [Paramecium sonneborni]
MQQFQRQMKMNNINCITQKKDSQVPKSQIKKEKKNVMK